jgi:hypothetical protein
MKKLSDKNTLIRHTSHVRTRKNMRARPHVWILSLSYSTIGRLIRRNKSNNQEFKTIRIYYCVSTSNSQSVEWQTFKKRARPREHPLCCCIMLQPVPEAQVYCHRGTSSLLQHHAATGTRSTSLLPFVAVFILCFLHLSFLIS